MMNIEYFAVLVPLFSLFIYFVAFSIECAAALLIFKPDFFGSKFHHAGVRAAVTAYIAPLWEVTNVFLVFALVAFIAFFPGAIALWGPALIVPIFFFLLVTGVRVLGMLFALYRTGTTNRTLLLVHAIASYLAPAVLFGGIFPYFLTGATGISWATLWIALLTLAATFVLGILFFQYRLKRNSRSFIFFLLSLLAVGTIFFGTAANAMPYLIFPAVTVFDAFTDPASASLMLWALLAAAIVIFPAILLLYRLSIKETR